MQNYAVYVPKLVTKEENFVPGHRACIGCGEALAVRLAAKVFGKNSIVVNVPFVRTKPPGIRAPGVPLVTRL